MKPGKLVKHHYPNAQARRCNLSASEQETYAAAQGYVQYCGPTPVGLPNAYVA